MNPFLSVLGEFGYRQTSDYAKGAKRIDYYAPDHHWKTNIQVVTHLRKGEPYKFEWRGAGTSGGSTESGLRSYLEQDRAKYEGMVKRHASGTGEFSPGRLPNPGEPDEAKLLAKARKPGQTIRTMARIQQQAHDWGLYSVTAAVGDWMRRVGATQDEMERYWRKTPIDTSVTRYRHNPSPGWFDRCMEGVSRSGSAYDPGAVCGALEKKMGYRRNPAIKPRGFKEESSGTLWYKEYKSLNAAERKLQELLHEGYRAAINFLNGKHRVRVGMDDGPGADYEENSRRRSRRRNSKTTFKSLSVGDKFVFSSEEDERFRFSGLARGPWVKTSSRGYRRDPDDGYKYNVGSINVGVIRRGASNPRGGRLTPGEASHILGLIGADRSTDFHTLSGSQVDRLLDEADKVKYRKSKSASGSRARMFFYYVQRTASSRRNAGPYSIRKTKKRVLKTFGRRISSATVRKAYGVRKNNPGRYTVLISGTAWVQGHELIISAKSASSARSEAKSWYRRQFPGKRVPGMSVVRTAWIDTAPNKRKKRNRLVHTPTASRHTRKAVEHRISSALRRYAARKPNRTRRRRY